MNFNTFHLGVTLGGLLGAFAASVGGKVFGVFLALNTYYIKWLMKMVDTGVTFYQIESQLGLLTGWKIYSGKQYYRYQ